MQTTTKVLMSSMCLLLAACGSKNMPKATNSFQHKGSNYLLCPSPKMIRYQAEHNRQHWNAAGKSVWAIINHTNHKLPELSEDYKIRLVFVELGHNRVLCRYSGVTEKGRKTFVDAQLQPHAFAAITPAGNNWRACSHQQRCNKVCYAVRTEVCPFSLNSPTGKSAATTTSLNRYAALGH